jgi:hypothetical protein
VFACGGFNTWPTLSWSPSLEVFILVVCSVNKSNTRILVVMWYDETIKRGWQQYRPHEFFSWNFGLALVGKDIVFRFIIEYSSLRDFDPQVIIIGLFLYDYFWKMIIWLVFKLEISYGVIIISWRILVSFRGFFEDYIFAWWNIWVSIILLLPP